MTEKKRGICLGTDLRICFQGFSNPSGSEWNVYLGNYEKSYNNVPFTAFIIGLLGSECRLSPNQNQRSAGPSGRQALATAVDWAQPHCVCSAFHSRPPFPRTWPWEVARVSRRSHVGRKLAKQLPAAPKAAHGQVSQKTKIPVQLDLPFSLYFMVLCVCTCVHVCVYVHMYV